MHIYDVTITDILLLYGIKQIDSMLSYVCLFINHTKV